MSFISATAVGGLGGFLLLLGAAVRSGGETEGGDSILGLAPVVGVVFLVAAAVYLTCGLGGVRTRIWGRILTILVQTIALGLTVLGIVTASTSPTWPFLLVAWLGAILVLAIVGKPGT